jgi:hypothetical protein
VRIADGPSNRAAHGYAPGSARGAPANGRSVIEVERTNAGLAIAILTERNSVAISMAPRKLQMSEPPLKTLEKIGDFQAEYEGSIPFTRSKSDLNDLARTLRARCKAILTRFDARQG